MKNPFKRTGFDSLITKGLKLVEGSMFLPANQVTIFDGEFIGDDVLGTDSDTTLVVGGTINATSTLCVKNLTVTGEITTKRLVVEGMLSIKAGAKITADKILYRSITIEDGAIVLAAMAHLDHVSEGEQT